MSYGLGTRFQISFFDGPQKKGDRKYSIRNEKKNTYVENEPETELFYVVLQLPKGLFSSYSKR